MTSRRHTDFSLEDALRDPGFTPRASDVPKLIGYLVGGDVTLARAADRALERIQTPIAVELARSFEATPNARGKRAIVRAATRAVTGRAPSPRAAPSERALVRDLAERALSDPDPGTRASAARAFAKLGDPAVSQLLRDASTRETVPRARVAMLEAVGSLGGAEAVAALHDQEKTMASGDHADESGLRERTRRARMIAERSLLRGSASLVRQAVSVGSFSRARGLHVTLACRKGLEEIVCSELPRELGARTVPGLAGRVDATLLGSLDDLFVARSALFSGFVIERRGELRDDLHAADRVAEVLAEEETKRLLRELTDGPIRVRIAWADGAKRRRATWRAAAALEDLAPEITSDPRESPWEALVHVGKGVLRVELLPKLIDRRFSYRVADVPAASHPTIAATLAHLGEARPEDVVWDPFVGSGLELCERARLGPFRRLIGTDVDPRALDRARANLSSLGVNGFELVLGNARTIDLGAPTLVLTNPPMGRRVARGQDLGELLAAVVQRVAVRLPVGGRMVLLSPEPRETRAAAEAAGLVPTLLTRVDLGGFEVELERFVRR